MAVSAESKSPELVKKIEDAGFDDWLLLPIKVEQLKDKVLLPLIQ